MLREYPFGPHDHRNDGEANQSESCYRRGFQQGAHAFLVAAKELGFEDDRLERWVTLTLWKWRFERSLSRRDLAPPHALDRKRMGI
ncbi:MAG TPA: hypothetical protein VGG68_00960 [Caulobacteraceae bacterium]|jgi:hypothetical protein